MLTLPVFLRDLQFKCSKYWVPHMKCLFVRVCFVFFFFAADGLIWAGRPWWRWCFGRLVWMHHSYIGGSSFSSFGPFQAVEGGGVACGLCSGSRAVCPGASPSEVYPAGKLPWHFTCGFDFRPSLWLPFEATFAVLKGLLKVPVGTMGLC